MRRFDSDPRLHFFSRTQIVLMSLAHASDNVFLLGAGFSADAQVPMMQGFMDKMWTLARTGRCRNVAIPQSQLAVLEEALKVREELDGYHGRAALDVWNIEDILSILSFSSKKRLDDMTKAIAQLIELTCTIKHDGKLNNHSDEFTIYSRFWRALIKWADDRGRPVPPILTFNYDLVLERSLLRALVGKYYRHSVKFGHEAVEVSYSGAVCEDIRLRCITGTWRDENFREEHGLILEDIPADSTLNTDKLLRLQILKLHGSVNFPRPKRKATDARLGSQVLTTPLEDPLILPPIFNKATDAVGKEVWTQALQVLRSCKRLIICGYSLPATDIYMQYFLKAALGPNQDLDHIYVFDPVLHGEDQAIAGRALRERYACNFSQPIQRRIQFQPIPAPNSLHGTAMHLVWLLEQQPNAILFG